MTDKPKQSDRAVAAVMQAMQDGMIFQDWMHPDWKRQTDPVIIDAEFTVVSADQPLLPAPEKQAPARSLLYYEPAGHGGVRYVYDEDNQQPGGSFTI